MYSIILVKGPGVGTVWEGYYRYFPIRIVTRSREEHETIIKTLDLKKLRYEVLVNTEHEKQQVVQEQELPEKKEQKQELELNDSSTGSEEQVDESLNSQQTHTKQQVKKNVGGERRKRSSSPSL